MISASPTFLAANASLQKKPIYAIVIEGYNKVFVKVLDNSSLPIFSGLTVVPWLV